MSEPEYVERIVVGGKSYSWMDPDAAEGENPRKIAKPGDTVKVTIRQALAFSHRLQPVEVAEAQAEAARVTAAAKRTAEQAEAAARRGVSVEQIEEEEEEEEDED